MSGSSVAISNLVCAPFCSLVRWKKCSRPTMMGIFRGQWKSFPTSNSQNLSYSSAKDENAKPSGGFVIRGTTKLALDHSGRLLATSVTRAPLSRSDGVVRRASISRSDSLRKESRSTKLHDTVTDGSLTSIPACVKIRALGGFAAPSRGTDRSPHPHQGFLDWHKMVPFQQHMIEVESAFRNPPHGLRLV